MMEIFKFIHLIEISRLVEISDALKFSGLWKPMYEAFTFHLSFDDSTLRKKNAAVFTEVHGKCVPDKGFDMRISNFLIVLTNFAKFRAIYTNWEIDAKIDSY